MIGFLKGLGVTLLTMARKPVTVQYPGRPADGDGPSNARGGEHIPLSPRWRDTAPAAAARVQPKVPTMGRKNAWKPLQKTAEVYHCTQNPEPTSHQP